MKALHFRTITGIPYDLNISDNASIADVKKDLNELFTSNNEPPHPEMELILHSSILSNTDIIKSQKIDDDDIIIISFSLEVPKLPKKISRPKFIQQEEGASDFLTSSGDISSPYKQNANDPQESLIKRLQTITSFSHTKCKMALEEAQYDFDQAYNILTTRKLTQPKQSEVLYVPPPTIKNTKPKKIIQKVYDLSELNRHNFGQFAHLLDTLKEDEKATLIRLLPLGNDDPTTLQMFIACEKNETIARNLLQETNH